MCSEVQNNLKNNIQCTLKQHVYKFSYMGDFKKQNEANNIILI